MQEAPVASVIIPTYNRASLLSRAIESVLRQTYTKFELIVVDDCSIDNTQGVVKSFSDPRLRFERNLRNMGVAYSRNRGIALARGEFVCLLDSDDYYLPEFLQVSLTKFLRSSQDVGFIWTGLRVVDQTGKLIYRGTWRPPLAQNGYEHFLRELRIGTGCGLTFRRSCLEIIKFDSSLRAAEDTEFFLRFVRQFRYDYVDQELIVINKHTGERVTKNLKSTLETYLKIVETHHDAIFRIRHLRLKYMEKIMTLAYKCGIKAVGRSWFFRSFPEVLLRPKFVIKFLYFEITG